MNVFFIDIEVGVPNYTYCTLVVVVSPLLCLLDTLFDDPLINLY